MWIEASKAVWVLNGVVAPMVEELSSSAAGPVVVARALVSPTFSDSVTGQTVT